MGHMFDKQLQKTIAGTVTSISWRRILNSHAEFTSEFTVQLSDGTAGVGSCPQGETIGLYEDRTTTQLPERLTRRVQESPLFGRPATQTEFDDYLSGIAGEFGGNLTFALSLAFFNAVSHQHGCCAPFPEAPAAPRPPALFLNLLNGGRHAYTNPVLSDFPEFMLVARTNNVPEVIQDHAAIQRAVKERLSSMGKVIVNGNSVHRRGTHDNREWLDLLSNALEKLGLSARYDLMIDASAGDMARDGRYVFDITDGSVRRPDEMIAYWLDLIHNHGLRFLEDPFAETDDDSWSALTAEAGDCKIIGDNFYCSDWRRIEEGATARRAHGVILKPNQAGTVTAICRATQTALRCGHIGVASHRSISTEETFLSTLAVMFSLPYIKIGPLFTDYSSIVRLNAIMRMAGDGASPACQETI